MLESGAVINGRYRVLRPLGEGGMGTVYEGEHVGVGRRVAIKVLRPEFATNADAVARFQREARSAAAIGHDNIVDVIDFGVEFDAPYMVMEFLKGESLGDRLEKHGALAPETAARIMGQLLSALAAAHASGIVHRDLKPDNVFLLQKPGARDFVKLLDFGISKFSQEERKPGGRPLTQTGVMIGTPLYMSPEQALAKQDLDHRADVYSAGVLLYQMVTGQLPFDADSEAELLLQVIYRPQPVLAPSALKPGLPSALDAAVLKAIAHDRDERFADCAEFARSLAPWGAVVRPSVFPSAPAPSLRRTGAGVAMRTPTHWETHARAMLGPATVVDSAWRARAPRRTMIAAGLAVVAVASLGVVLLVKGRPPARLPTAVVASVSTSAPAPASTVSIDLEQLPPDAVFTVDGRPAATPHLSFPRGSVHAIRVTAPGRVAYETSVVADRDRALVVALAAAPSAERANPVVARTVVRSAPHVANPPRRPPPVAPARPHTDPTHPLPVSREF